MAMELHRITVGAEVVAIVAREQNRASKGLPESQRPQSLKAKSHRLASLAIIKERAWIWNLPWCRASLPGESAEVVVCRWIEPLAVPGRDDCQHKRTVHKRRFVHPVLRRTG